MNHLRVSEGVCGASLGLGIALTSRLIGLEAHEIRVEASCTRGPSFFQMVGLAEAAVRESRVRVASALERLGVLLDEYAITVNLAPADLRKGGASLDLSLALAILAAIKHLPAAALSGTLVLGELSLDGAVRSVRGVLPQLQGAQIKGLRRAIVPSENAREASFVSNIDVRSASNLACVVAALNGNGELPQVERIPFTAERQAAAGDLSDVRGQPIARRALEIAAAGGHNLLMIGPPGGGKTLLARLMPTILPPMSFEEAIETTAIHSVAGLVDPARGVVAQRPFRAPHHSVSEAGLIGGGEIPRPGEVSLAHHGILFLDELAEFRKGALEALRQPLEDGLVCIARAKARAYYPARPVVVGAVNPCPCGYRGHPVRRCECSEATRDRYQRRLSGPLLDRLDVHVGVRAMRLRELMTRDQAESSATVRARVITARKRQLARAKQHGWTTTLNAHLSVRQLEGVVKLSKQATSELERAVNKFGLSARGFVKVLRVARTIADLEGEKAVRTTHISESLQARLFDRQAEAA